MIETIHFYLHLISTILFLAIIVIIWIVTFILLVAEIKKPPSKTCKLRMQSIDHYNRMIKYSGPSPISKMAFKLFKKYKNPVHVMPIGVNAETGDIVYNNYNDHNRFIGHLIKQGVAKIKKKIKKR